MNAYSISKLADDACVSVHVVRDYMGSVPAEGEMTP